MCVCVCVMMSVCALPLALKHMAVNEGFHQQMGVFFFLQMVRSSCRKPEMSALVLHSDLGTCGLHPSPFVSPPMSFRPRVMRSSIQVSAFK